MKVMIRDLRKCFFAIVIFVSVCPVGPVGRTVLGVNAVIQPCGSIFDFQDGADYETDYIKGGAGVEIPVNPDGFDRLEIRKGDVALDPMRGEIAEGKIVLNGGYLDTLYVNVTWHTPETEARFTICGFKQSQKTAERILIVYLRAEDWVAEPIGAGKETGSGGEGSESGGVLPENDLPETPGGETTGGASPRKKSEPLKINPATAAGLYIGGGAVCVSLSAAGFIFLFRKKKTA